MSGITVNLAGNSGAGVSPYAQPQPQQPTSPINPGDGATRQDGDTAAGATPTTDTAAARERTSFMPFIPHSSSQICLF